VTFTGLLLDCSSAESAIQSYASVVGVPTKTMLRLVENTLVDWTSSDVAPENQIARQLGVKDDGEQGQFSVRWFHATRALPGEKFQEGLLPTLQALPKLWRILGHLAAEWVGDSEWADYQTSFSRGDRTYSRQFRNKRVVRGWEGPFAFLVRDAATGKHGHWHKDFTSISETAEDICSDFESEFGYPLRSRYESALRPCLVSFVWPEPPGSALRATANYIFHSLRNIDCGRDCNANFSARGKAVGFELIDRIEWLDR
jgi:hypothetical protein